MRDYWGSHSACPPKVSFHFEHVQERQPVLAKSRSKRHQREASFWLVIAKSKIGYFQKIVVNYWWLGSKWHKDILKSKFFLVYESGILLFFRFDTILFSSVEDKYPLVLNKRENFALRLRLPLMFLARVFLSSKQESTIMPHYENTLHTKTWKQMGFNRQHVCTNLLDSYKNTVMKQNMGNTRAGL